MEQLFHRFCEEIGQASQPTSLLHEGAEGTEVISLQDRVCAGLREDRWGLVPGYLGAVSFLPLFLDSKAQKER